VLADVVTGVRKEAAIDLYQTLRQPAAAQVIGIADCLTTLATVPTSLKRLLRNALLRVVGSLPFLRRRIAMSLWGLGRAALAEVPRVPPAPSRLMASTAGALERAAHS
jgi:2-polyprenyl-6-methoxyphenol hydroxylase-like FAD-dependent oxidoreductase